MTNVDRRPIAIEEPGEIKAADGTVTQQFMSFLDTRLEAMVVGGVTGDAAGPGFLGELGQSTRPATKKRLLDENVLAVGNQELDQLELAVVGRADDRRVEVLERDLGYVAICRV